MKRRWVYPAEADAGVVESLAVSIRVDSCIAQILVQRGVSDFDSAKRFFRPSVDMLHDPFLMKDMDRAVERLHQALEQKERILVYGDYDVDGTTAVATVFSFLRDVYDESLNNFYLPHRYREGYGVSKIGRAHV